MNIKRVVLLLLVLVAAIGGLKYKEARDERESLERAARTKASLPPPKPVRKWRWPEEPEWVIHQITRTMASWPTDPKGPWPTLAVKRQPASVEPGVFEVGFTGGATRPLSIKPGVHLWDPGAYVEAAAALLGDGLPDAEESVPAVSALLLSSDTDSLVKANGLVFSALNAHRRSPRLHEQSALLFAAHAMRESARGRVDPRPFLNGLVAHLALARALAPKRAPSEDAMIAGIAIDVLLERQIDAMQGLIGIPGAWGNALRMRVTHDPRLGSSAPPSTRLEKLEALIALRASRVDCGVVMPTAESWGMKPAADWAREALRCFDAQYADRLGNPFVLQTEDAARLAGLKNVPIDEVIPALSKLSQDDSQQPAQPTSVVPTEMRADAGLRHIAQAYELVVDGAMSRSFAGTGTQINRDAQSFRSSLPHDPFLELAVTRRDSRVSPGDDLCVRMVKLVVSRPDLLSDGDWAMTAQCAGHEAMKPVDRHGWEGLALVGTGLTATGPWHVGVEQKAPSYDETVARAPWDVQRTWDRTYARALGFPTDEQVLAVFSRVLEYDVNSMMSVMRESEDADELQRLGERACAIEAEACADAGARLIGVGRVEAAMPLGKRAITLAHGEIRLSGSMSWYVSMLQERGQLADAMRIAKRMGDVYSSAGLNTLGKAYERMGQFEDAADAYRRVTERYGNTQDEDEFYLRHAERYGAAPFEAETKEALGRVFPNGLRKIALAQAAQATRPLSLNNRFVFSKNMMPLGLTIHDSLVAVDGYVVETPEQNSAIYSFSDGPVVTYIVKREDGRIEEIKGELYHGHYAVVVKRKSAA